MKLDTFDKVAMTLALIGFAQFVFVIYYKLATM
jgi:hypothetical protein